MIIGMKNVLILGSRKLNDKGFGSGELMAEKVNQLLNGQGIHYSWTTFKDLFYSFGHGEADTIIDLRSHRPLDNFDFIFIRDWFKTYRTESLAVAEFITAKGMPYWNKEAYLQRSSGKLSQYAHLSAIKGSIPSTFCGPTEEIVRQIEEGKLQLPFIVKASSGSRGRDNFLVESIEQFKTVMESTEQLMVVQAFIPNNEDYRVICVDGSPQLVMKRSRTKSDTHLNNTSQGADAELLNVDELQQLLGSYWSEFLRMAKAIAQRWGRNLTGVDIIIDERGKFYILESNNLPQLEKGAFVEDKLKLVDEHIKSILAN